MSTAFPPVHNDPERPSPRNQQAPTSGPESSTTSTSRRSGDDALELLEPYDPAPGHPSGRELPALLAQVGANHFALNVDDAAAAYEKLQADGSELVTELLEGRFFFCRDPFGTLIEVRERK